MSRIIRLLQSARINWAHPLNRGLLFWQHVDNEGEFLRSGAWQNLAGTKESSLINGLGTRGPGVDGNQSSLYFDGSNDYAKWTGGVSINTAFSFSCWANIATGQPALMSHSANDPEPASNWDQCLFLQSSSGKLAMYAGTPSGTLYTDSGVPTSGWHHYAVTTIPGSTTTLYVDGVAVKTGTQSFNSFSNWNFYLGYARSFGGTGILDPGRNYFLGLMTDVRYWTRTLTQGEMSAVYRDLLDGHPHTLIRNEARQRTLSYKGIRKVSVLSPNGGEDWIVGDLKNISFSAPFIGSVDIALSTDSGSTYANIASGQTTSPYSWTVASPTATAKIKVTAADGGGSESDESDATFRIATTSPSGGGGGGAPIVGSAIVRGI